MSLGACQGYDSSQTRLRQALNELDSSLASSFQALRDRLQVAYEEAGIESGPAFQPTSLRGSADTCPAGAYAPADQPAEDKDSWNLAVEGVASEGVETSKIKFPVHRTQGTVRWSQDLVEERHEAEEDGEDREPAEKSPRESFALPLAIATRTGRRRADHDQPQRSISLMTRMSANGVASNEIVLKPIWQEMRVQNAIIGRVGSTQGLARRTVIGTPRRSDRVSLRMSGKLESFGNFSEEAWAYLAPIKPHSHWRVAWDTFGLLFVIYDAFVVPCTLAFQLDQAAFVLEMARALLAYWCLDILLNFNTGFYEKGILQMSRRRIIPNYLLSWFLIDAGLVSLDFYVLTQSGTNSALSGIRMLRLMRLLRLAKLSRLSRIVEEISVAFGRPWILQLTDIFYTLLGMVISTHLVVTFWCLVGKSVSDSGGTSWIDNDGAANLSDWMQYLHALQWVLCPPNPPPLEADSMGERIYSLGAMIFTFVLIGWCISKMTNVIQQLNDMHSELHRKRREVRHYLSTNKNVSVDLSLRIMRFVEYALSKKRAATLDVSLISETLQKELYVSQQGQYLSIHPLLLMLKESFPDVFAEVCGSVSQPVYEKGEVVFSAGSWAQSMIITGTGSFSLHGLAEEPRDIHQGSWFGEPSLFTTFLHTSTLTASTFADVFSLTGEDLARCARYSPSSCQLICEYGEAFLKAIQVPEVHSDEYDMIECSATALAAIHYHQDPDAEQLAKVKQMAEENPADASAKDFVEAILSKELDANDVPQKLEEYFWELKHDGVYLELKQEQELNNALNACSSLVYLLMGDYRAFTDCQGHAARVTKEQWQELQDIVRWVDASVDGAHAVLVLLACKGLEKVPLLRSEVPKGVEGGRALLTIFEKMEFLMPSIKGLCEKGHELLEDLLRINEDFSFLQFLQGENTPANIKELERLAQAEGGMKAFKLYVLFLLGFMCGPTFRRRAAAKKNESGAVPPESVNAQFTILGLQALQQIGRGRQPQAIYWSYIASRAQLIGLPTAVSSDFALARLACLNGAETLVDLQHVLEAWQGLDSRDRETLKEHFLADGIDEQAHHLLYLPHCFKRAKENPAAGLQALLEILAELVDLLCAKKDVQQNVPVDLADLASFIAVVRSQVIFRTCIERSRVNYGIRNGKRSMQLEMTSKNWSRSSDIDGEDIAMAYGIRKLLRRQKALEEAIQPLHLRRMSTGAEHLLRLQESLQRSLQRENRTQSSLPEPDGTRSFVPGSEEGDAIPQNDGLRSTNSRPAGPASSKKTLAWSSWDSVASTTYAWR